MWSAPISLPRASLARRAPTGGKNARLLRRDEPPEKLRSFLADHREVGGVGLEVTDEKIEDVVLARVDTGGEARPRRRRLGRLRRLERQERALARELAEVRELPFGHEALRERRVHPVEADEEDLVRGATTRLTALAGAGAARGGQPP